MSKNPYKDLSFEIKIQNKSLRIHYLYANEKDENTHSHLVTAHGLP